MEPLSALGVASNVIQFVDFAGKLISRTIHIYRARTTRDDDEDDHSHLERITRHLAEHNEAFKESLDMQQISQPAKLSSADRDILRICTECEQITTKLLTALDKLRSEKVTVWNSFVDALRAVWSEGDIQTLRQTLDSYRQQISLYLLASVRDEIRAFQRSQSSRDANLLTTVKQTQDTVEDFFDKMKKERNQIWQYEFWDQKRDWEQDIIKAMHEDYQRKKYFADSRPSPAVRMQTRLADDDNQHFHQGLLTWLRFTELDNRHDKISRAYEKTFEWIFHAPPNDQWSDFVKWLEGDTEPLYWITGKPAAGKSTLMKFIYTDPRTSQQLRSWANGRKLIVCAFYFWNSGTQLQMSQEGMARTLLYEALHQASELWTSLFPHKMEEFVAFGNSWRRPITWDEMMRAFRVLVNGAGKDYKLFFFIDGLDEFDGSHEKLVTMIQGFLSPHVKTCVSSRPWNVFEDGFQQRPSLRLEDLTYRDIKHFVSSRFLQNRGFAQLRMLDPQYADQLIENITLKASGVFLWVSLVTKSLLEGLSDGERLEDLQARLDALPTDLETLFWRVLTHLGDFHLARASQLLQIIRASLVPLTLLMLSYADEGDPDLAAKTKIGPISISKANARAGILRRRLNACCKGLIESKAGRTQHLADANVSYLHRTVKDYIEREDIWSKFKSVVDRSFNPYVRLCNAYIIKLKISNQQFFQGNNSGKDFWDIVTYAIEYATLADPACKNGVQTKFLNELDATASHHASLTRNAGSAFTTFEPRATHWSASKPGCILNESFLHFAVQCQLTDYVREILSSPMIKPASPTSALLVALIECESFTDSEAYADRPSIRHVSPNSSLVSMLLEHGADPNARIQDALLLVTGTPGKFSPWQVFLQTWANYGFYDELARTFLAHGADPRLAKKYFIGGEVAHLAKKKRREARISRVSNFFGSGEVSLKI